MTFPATCGGATSICGYEAFIQQQAIGDHRGSDGPGGPKDRHPALKRAGLWGLVAAYTLALPYANFYYRVIVGQFSRPVSGQISSMLLLLLAAILLLSACLKKRFPGSLAYLIPGALVAGGMVFWIANRTSMSIFPSIFSWPGWSMPPCPSIVSGKGLHPAVFIRRFAGR